MRSLREKVGETEWSKVSLTQTTVADLHVQNRYHAVKNYLKPRYTSWVYISALCTPA